MTPPKNPTPWLRFRSSITGRWVRWTTALRWRRFTVAEQIVTPPDDTDE